MNRKGQHQKSLNNPDNPGRTREDKKAKGDKRTTRTHKVPLNPKTPKNPANSQTNEGLHIRSKPASRPEMPSGIPQDFAQKDLRGGEGATIFHNNKLNKTSAERGGLQTPNHYRDCLATNLAQMREEYTIKSTNPGSTAGHVLICSYHYRKRLYNHSVRLRERATPNSPTPERPTKRPTMAPPPI